jgi:hypothetical protein
MTKQELNRDIKRLFKEFKKAAENLEIEKYFEVAEELKKEFRRLYDADRELKYVSKDNILRMLILNRRHRVIPFHQFGTGIDEDKLY